MGKGSGSLLRKAFGNVALMRSFQLKFIRRHLRLNNMDTKERRWFLQAALTNHGPLLELLDTVLEFTH